MLPARPFRGATSGGEGTNYAFACSPARVRIITARYLNAIAVNTATGVTAAALDCISEAGLGLLSLPRLDRLSARPCRLSALPPEKPTSDFT